MKKFLINILLMISLIIPFNVRALSTTEANEEIDVTKDSSLTLNYYYDDYKFNDVNVDIYYIASVSSHFQYELSSDFSSYSLKINGLKTTNEWDSLKDTLNSYIEADSIEKTISGTINNNVVEFSNLKTGLYLVKTDKIDTEKYSLIFDSFLISVPDLKEDGSWNYDVEVFPKAKEYTPKYEKINYTAVKQWRDDGKNRPESVEIEIYEDGNLVDNQILSSDNNWTYEWTTDDDGSSWSVVERNVPEGYNVSISKKDKNFIVVNTDPLYEEKNPQTLDGINLYLFIFVGSVIGLIMLLVSLMMQKRCEK